MKYEATHIDTSTGDVLSRVPLGATELDEAREEVRKMTIGAQRVAPNLKFLVEEASKPISTARWRGESEALAVMRRGAK